MTEDVFRRWIDRWHATADGLPFETTYQSRLLPVRVGGVQAILKISSGEEERKGGALLEWYQGDGAVRVFEREGHAILMERATGRRSLADMARGGEDDEATRILCATAVKLHASRIAPPPETLVPLPVWFRALEPMAAQRGGIFGKSHTAARGLLEQAGDIVVLHGDLHHENVLDGGARGWLAIDPKGLLGDRGYDFANLFCNPDAATAIAPGRLQRQLKIASHETRIEPERLLQWVLAYCGLSASWSLGDGHDPKPAMTIAEIAAAELGW